LSLFVKNTKKTKEKEKEKKEVGIYLVRPYF